MAEPDLLLIRFRQSSAYTFEMLIRDLIEHTKELNKKLKELEDRITDLETP